MIVGIVIGVAIMVFGILCYMAGYGMADQKHTNLDDK